jgi:hypothetical protein
MRRIGWIGLAAVLALLGGAAAWASIPDAGGVIHACRTTKGGTIRVIDTDVGQTCGKDEAPLTWNQAGPQGPQGPAGIPGGISGYEQVTTVQRYISGPADLTANCPTGKRVTGGGWSLVAAPGTPTDASPANANSNYRNGPNGDTSWRTSLSIWPSERYNPSTNTWEQFPVDFTVYAVCATAG